MEETRIVIVHKPGNVSVGVFNNNPWAGKEAQRQMLTAHISYFIRNMVANGASCTESVLAVASALETATEEFTGGRR